METKTTFTGNLKHLDLLRSLMLEDTCVLVAETTLGYLLKFNPFLRINVENYVSVVYLCSLRWPWSRPSSNPLSIRTVSPLRYTLCSGSKAEFPSVFTRVQSRGMVHISPIVYLYYLFTLIMSCTWCGKRYLNHIRISRINIKTLIVFVATCIQFYNKVLCIL